MSGRDGWITEQNHEGDDGRESEAAAGFHAEDAENAGTFLRIYVRDLV